VLDKNLSETFGEITWKYKIDELINRLFGILNEINNKKGYQMTVSTTYLSNELFETLKILENCSSCNLGKYNLDKFHESVSKMENLLANLEKEEQGKDNIANVEIVSVNSEEEEEEEGKDDMTNALNNKLIDMNDELNIKVLCENCKRKKIEKLTDKYGNEEMARFLYDCKLNISSRIEWIPFSEFRNIEYLAKGGFGEVHKAAWIDHDYNYYDYEDLDVVLKGIYNSGNKILDILKEVKKKV